SDLILDRVEQALTFSAADSQFRGRVSGTLDLEGYVYQLPAPGLIDSAGDRLFVPRLSLFLDAQFGPRVYAFAQARVDRGFDPGRRDAEARLDEWALRYTPWRDGRLNLQAGRFATIVGNWSARHNSWNNPFITAPLPYEHLTGIWDAEAVRSSNTLLQWSHVRPGLPASIAAIEKSLRVPIVWGPGYASGVAVSGDIGRLRYAAEAKLGSLSSRPEAWHHGREQRHHPTFSARLGYRPNQMWTLGVSASRGSYLREFAGRPLAPGASRGDYRQIVLAHDIGYAWRHLQVWAEIYASRFEIPGIGDADTLAWYVEAKYKFTPRLFGALRWNQQLFDRIPDRGTTTKWGHDVWRVDFAPGFRFTPHTQLKFQYSLLHGERGTRDFSRTVAAQFTLRF
ncbi:MAG: hypothetical protein ACREH8_16140, partial [Opitutaceae bacterium]